jgi:hypothetical protein
VLEVPGVLTAPRPAVTIRGNGAVGSHKELAALSFDQGDPVPAALRSPLVSALAAARARHRVVARRYAAQVEKLARQISLEIERGP